MRNKRSAGTYTRAVNFFCYCYRRGEKSIDEKNKRSVGCFIIIKNDDDDEYIYIYFSIRFLSTVNECMKCINNREIEIINAYEMTE